MVLSVLAFALLTLLFGGWYVCSLHYHRRKTRRALSWIEAAMAGHGRVIGMNRATASSFKANLQLTSGVFHRAWVLVDLIPCQTPVVWLYSRLTHRSDQLTFEADLDWAPSFSLEVHNFHWSARSRRNIALTDEWNMDHAGPFIISTRMEWQKEITAAMSSLAGKANHDFQSIRFSRRSPHFSVSMPLQTIAPESPARTCVFDAVREVAVSSLPSLF
jgi:hypothetical protein